MILKESQIDPDTVRTVLGPPFKKNGKLLTATGSSFYFIRFLNNLNGESILKWEHSKAIFQRHEKGLALYINRSNYQRAVLIPEDTITEIRLLQQITARDHSDSSLAAFSELISKLTFGLIRIPAQLSEKETVLEIETKAYRGRLSTNFSSYHSQKNYFSDLKLGDRFKSSH